MCITQAEVTEAEEQDNLIEHEEEVIDDINLSSSILIILCGKR